MFDLAPPIYWLIIFIALLIFEIITMGLTTIWFAGGALVAALVSLLNVGVPIQIGVFLFSSVVLLILTRPIAMKHLNKKVEKTNTERLIGLDTIVIEDIDALHGIGKVRVNGIEWSAMASNANDKFVVDDIVTIEGIQGVKAIVTRKQMD